MSRERRILMACLGIVIFSSIGFRVKDIFFRSDNAAQFPAASPPVTPSPREYGKSSRHSSNSAGSDDLTAQPQAIPESGLVAHDRMEALFAPIRPPKGKESESEMIARLRLTPVPDSGAINSIDNQKLLVDRQKNMELGLIEFPSFGKAVEALISQNSDFGILSRLLGGLTTKISSDSGSGLFYVSEHQDRLRSMGVLDAIYSRLGPDTTADEAQRQIDFLIRKRTIEEFRTSNASLVSKVFAELLPFVISPTVWIGIWLIVLLAMRFRQTSAASADMAPS